MPKPSSANKRARNRKRTGQSAPVAPTTAAPQLRSGIRDNRERGTAGSFLKSHLYPHTRLSVVSGYFTISAYGALRDELEQIEGMRFLYGAPELVGRMRRDDLESKAFRLTEQGLTLANQLAQSALARQCAAWIEGKAEIRSVKGGFVHGKLYHLRRDEDHALLGSSNFTVPGLGLGVNPNVELNLVVDSSRDREDLLAWFDEWWRDDERTEDVKQDVLDQLASLYANQPPEFIYYLTLFHLFRDLLDGQKDTDAEVSGMALPETHIWRTLYEFQRDGARAIIAKMRALNGCILADSVGLGKTYTALAVIKYFELKNERVLVLCPKKLRFNWTIYGNNSKLNPFLEDRFRYDVLSHTDLSRDGGMTGDIDLATINWGNYDLVVIDESHNFRNNNRARQVEGEPARKSRYQRLIEDIVKHGIKTKVLLLSATPVNNDLRDLRNQISFIGGGDVTLESAADAAFKVPLGLSSVQQTIHAAQRKFDAWSKSPASKRKVATLLEDIGGDFFRLLDGLSIARSRTHIRRHYAKEMERLGGFPKRAKPEAVYPAMDLKNGDFSFERLDERINRLSLALYNPAGYLRKDLADEVKAEYEKEVVNGFTQAGRERILIGMMKVNLLKRLESSVESFRLTLTRTLAKIDHLLERMDAFAEHQQANPEVEYNEVALDDMDDPEDDDGDFAIGGKRRFHLGHIDVPKWRELLDTDGVALKALLAEAEAVSPKRDAKLSDLWSRIASKLEEPTKTKENRRNRKTLVFTAFADTADYLYENLQGKARAAGSEIALVRGDGRNKTSFGRTGFDDILTNFSPISKHRADRAGAEPSKEIDVLIATDCISEGQNLQDCDLLINYDIHWNPVRIIQRFGRIDRISSHSRAVRLVNFWPVKDLDRYLNVQNRVEARMALVDVTATGGDNLLEDAQATEQIQQELQFRDRQLVRLKDQVVDLDDLDDTISLADFSLDEFRIDLLRFLESRREELEAADLGLYAVVPPVSSNSMAQPGAIFCLRHTGSGDDATTSRRDGDDSAWVNPLGKHYLIYVRDDGDVRLGFTSAKRSLSLLRDLAAGIEAAHNDLCDLFDQRTKQGSDMDHYDTLIQAGLQSIARTFGRQAVAQLAKPDGRLPKASDQPTQDDSEYELVTWLAILAAKG
ncbi:MAG: ATP-dependent helicase [Gammaproteobacteria bacterium]|nr:ATP-dependent helicase [Gammaproteobacteria bacterium]